jgi:hypothetical protein
MSQPGSCVHGKDPYTCGECDDDKRKTGVYDPPCTDGQHDLPTARRPWLGYYCQRCGHYDRWDH